jgi:hypothetical protein
MFQEQSSLMQEFHVFGDVSSLLRTCFRTAADEKVNNCYFPDLFMISKLIQ